MECQDLSLLQNALDNGLSTNKYRKLTAAICDVIEDFGLVSFTTLDIQDNSSILSLMYLVDKSNGYAYSGLPTVSTITNAVSLKEVDLDFFRIHSIKEKYNIDEELEDIRPQDVAMDG
jgi:hypothetical protein